MPNQNPYITRTREEPLPFLGWPWEVATQVEDSNTNVIQSRVFNVLTLGTPEVIKVSGKPPDYPDNNVSAYYRVSRPLTQTQWVGVRTLTNDPNHPLFALNNFQGWQATPYEFALETWYLDLLHRSITWQPKLEDWTDPNTALISPVPTNQYELLIKNSEGGLISSSVQDVGEDELLISLDGSSWGAARSTVTGSAAGYLVNGALDTSTSFLITSTRQTAAQSHIRLIKPSATYNPGGAGVPPSLTDTSSITINIYGVYWFGDVRFLDEIGETTVHMHPAGASEATRLKPPGYSHLSTQYNAMSYLGQGTPVTQTRAGSIGIVS